MAKNRTREIGRGSWSGTLRVGLVTVPVRAVNIHLPEAEIHLHQLHEACDRRINYRKVCPAHGEVTSDEIVSAYEYDRDKYVRIEPDELDKLRTDADRSLTIETFIRAGSLDPLYLDGRNYYLVPPKADAEGPYGVLYRAMVEMDRWGIGHILFSEREQLVLVRPHDELLVMSMLHYSNEMRSADEFKFELPRATDKMVKLAEKLIEGVTETRFDFSAYEDLYKVRLKEVIDAKIEGREIVAPEKEEELQVINLADALKKSIAQSHGGGRAQKPAKTRPTRRPARRRRRA